MQKLCDFLYFLFKPHFWIMNDDYDEMWDIQLNSLMDKLTFENVNEYTAVLGNQKIWVANYPYACFTDYSNHFLGRPSRRTIIKARKKLINDFNQSLSKKV